MFTRVRLCLGTMLVACALSSAATAATVENFSFTSFGRSDLSAARSEMSSFLATHTVSNLRLETFEGYGAWNGQPARPTRRTPRSAASPPSAAPAPATRWSAPARSRRCARTTTCAGAATTPTAGALGGKWLDSNDNTGINWQIGGVGKFNALGLLRDRRGGRGRQVLDQGRRHALLRPRRRRRQARRTATSTSCASCSPRRWRT